MTRAIPAKRVGVARGANWSVSAAIATLVRMLRHGLPTADHQWRPRALGIVLAGLLLPACLPLAQESADPYRWTRFVHVEGQPEPVPEEWVSTPEGRFAHSLKIPNPVPKDSGYRPGMSSEAYFNHLCKSEAGEFIFRKVEGVEGFYFARPPQWPTDEQLMSRYRLEAPELERFFQLLRAIPEERSLIFVHKGSALRYVEEPIVVGGVPKTVRAYGFVNAATPRSSEISDNRLSRYALTWRGLRRQSDRELAISGSEWIVYDVVSNQILGILRNFGRTGATRNAPEGVWWLNAIPCASVRHASSAAAGGERLHQFVTNVLRSNSEPTR